MFLKSVFLSFTFCFLNFGSFVYAQDIQPKTEPTSFCKSKINDDINNIINRPDWQQSRWGILIKNLQSGEVLYSLNSDKFFIPASNVKLLVTAASLLKFGSNFSLKTPIYLNGNSPNLDSLIIQGKGDPSLKTEDLQDLLKQLKEQDVSSINTLVIDDSYFPEFPINNSWEWSDLLTYYAPSINSLILNENAVILTILPTKIGNSVQLSWSDEIAANQWEIDNQAFTSSGNSLSNITINEVLGKPTLAIRGSLPLDSKPDVWGLSILDPANYFALSLQKLLLAEGIKVDNVRVIKSSDNSYEIGDRVIFIKSDNLSQLITETNQNSNNLFAESLLKILQVEFKNDRIVNEILNSLGVNPDTFILADGSGLSRQNLVTPEALVNTLRLMLLTLDSGSYKESLAIAGVNGTLKNRFQDTNVVGNMRGKTGSLSGVSALSGYLERESFPLLVFSIIINNTQQPSQLQRQTIDEIVILLRNLRDDC
jgi:D-alanyl-D-alanine carboxypeptidase/D-alanyl-D-alanine-endopeptidase (penicillin-binding protein 4)